MRGQKFKKSRACKICVLVARGEMECAEFTNHARGPLTFGFTSCFLNNMREDKLINWLQLVPFVFVLVYSCFGLASTTDSSELKREYHSFSYMEIDFLEFLSASNDPNTHKKRREFLSQNLTKRGNMDLYQNICGPKLKKNSEYS